MIEREWASRIKDDVMKVTVTLGPQTTLLEAMAYAEEHVSGWLL